MSDKEIDKELNEQELKRVSNALDALQQHKQTPTKRGWEAIMEESKTRSIKVTKRTKILSVAATAAIVLAVAGAILIATQNNKTAKTVDQEKKETNTTTATIPQSPEQRLLNRSLILKSDPNGPGGQSFGMVFFDGEDNREVADISVPGYTSYNEPKRSNNHLSFRTGDEYCEGQDELISSVIVDLKTLKAEKLQGIAQRSYSPEGKSYFDLIRNCNGPGNEIRIYDKNGNIRKTYSSAVSKNVKYEGINGSGVADQSELSVTDAIWVSESRLFVNLWEEIQYEENNPAEIGATTKDGWYQLDLDEDTSLSQAKEIEDLCCRTNAVIQLLDVRVSNNRTYLLTIKETFEPTIEVVDFSTREVLWSKTFNVDQYSSVKFAAFGKNVNEIYGSLYAVFDEVERYEFQAFGYDNKSNTLVFPKGGILINR